MPATCSPIRLAGARLVRLPPRPAASRPSPSYGYHRFQVLAAFVNGLTLFAIAAWITIEAARRLADPVEILAGPMLVVAVLGLLVNIAAFLILGHGGHENLNIRGAALHVLGDLLVRSPPSPPRSSSSGPAGPRTTRSSRPSWRSSSSAPPGPSSASPHILLEGTPENVDPATSATA